MQGTVNKDLVLVGGGHSHVAVLKAFGMRPLPGVRLTLISRHTETPYSGMLPGLIAGRYSFDEAHIDLAPLSRFAGARFFRDEAVGVDPQAQTVALAGRPPVAYDVLSINSGSTPSTVELNGTRDTVIPVKPIDEFLARWQRLVERARKRDRPTKIAVVGGGAGGVELALAVHAKLDAVGLPSEIELLTDEADVLMAHNRRVRAKFNRILGERGIGVHANSRVIAAERGTLRAETGATFACDEILWVTEAAAAPWIAASGLAVDERGFLLVNDCLQSSSHPNIFGAGDIAAMGKEPRPKSGVFAVRQGRPLARNLRRALLGQRLEAYRPQRRFLSLIGTGDGSAVASRGIFTAEGRRIWSWKEWIDRRFMARYQVLPDMAATKRESPKGTPERVRGGGRAAAPADAMRCGGCGAKVGAAVLNAALAGLENVAREDVVVGLDAPDDAALLAAPAGKLLAVSVDAFRPMIDDPYLFGQITANHCLNDLYAIGADPQSALTIAALPVWPEAKLIDELEQMLAGALRVFRAETVALVGGHTSEAAELSLGFSVTGLVDRNAILKKTGLAVGDRLVLTKPLGTGAILAADMRAKAKGRWVDGAVATMLESNAAASRRLRRYGPRACTDVTGFGLFGHLVEMAAGSKIEIALDLDALPVLDGAIDAVAAGFTSTMQPKNEQATALAECSEALRQHPAFPLLFDPQTAGGLLAAVPGDRCESLLAELRAAGYDQSAVIGRIGPGHGVQRVQMTLATGFSEYVSQ